MSIETMSAFYYSPAIDLTNRYLDFSEGGPTITAVLSIGSYSPSDLISAVAAALNAVGGQIYTVSLNRATQRVTISAPGIFQLRISTGPYAGSSVFSTLGFTGADLTGANTYTGNANFGTIYRPQYLLQSYTPFENWEDSVSASVNESAAGVIETLSFGTRNFMECEIKFITNLQMGDNGPIENNPTGVADARNFYKFLRLKTNLEFIPDRDTPNTFDKILLEESPESSDGVGFKLMEMIDMGLANFYSTGVLKFRKVV